MSRGEIVCFANVRGEVVKLEVRIVARLRVGELHPLLAGALGHELPRPLPDRDSTGVLDESCAAGARIAEERGQNIPAVGRSFRVKLLSRERGEGGGEIHLAD